MNTFIRKAALCTITCGLGATLSGAAAQQENYEQALRELNIMTNIFEAMLEQESGADGLRFSSAAPDGLFLANQGMVFTFNVGNNVRSVMNFGGRGLIQLGRDWQEFGVNVAQIASEAAARAMASFPEVEFDFDYDFDFNTGPTPGSAEWTVRNQEAVSAQREMVREMAEAMRDRQEDIQDLQRDLRDLQRDLRGSRAEEAELRQELAESEQELARERQALDEQRQAYQQYIDEYDRRVNAALSSFNEEFSSLVISTLCDYGTTLRSLGDDLHVTLIFENFEDQQDRVYVFDAGAVASCGAADTLRQNAMTYLM